MGIKRDTTHLANFKNGRKFGFTLAEVLVTLGIIGVVSAMTIPSLTQNWQKRAYVTQLHKAYSEIQQAFVNEMNQKNAVNLLEASILDSDINFLHEQFKIVKRCGDPDPCFAKSYKNLNGGTVSLSPSGPVIITGSGVALQINIYTYPDDVDFSDIDDFVNRASIGNFWVDINGQKGPNILGRDLFRIYFYPDGSLDAAGIPISCRKYGTNCESGNTPKETRDYLFNQNCKSKGNDLGGCFGKILNDNWEMKY